MKKKQKGFVCTNCGYQDRYYHVICPSCGAEDSMVDLGSFLVDKKKASVPEVVYLSDIEDDVFNRIVTPWEELNHVLGGGIAQGSVVLLAGPPGVGKSTFALTIAQVFDSPLYVSGEESLSQMASRAKRLGINQKFAFAYSKNLDGIKQLINTYKMDLLVIDSLQVMSVHNSVAFISHNEARIFMSELVNVVKKLGITTIVLGHITKEGTVAGPKTVEHLVDVVLYLNTTSRYGIRSLHVGKNRFGPSDGVMFLKMTNKGLSPLADRVVLEENGDVGQAYTIVVQGNTPNIVDVQVLITPSYTNLPKRVVSGYPSDKFYLLLAILEKRLNLKLYNKDVFVRVSGEYYWRDAAIDAAVVAGIISAYYNIVLPGNVIWVGEVDLLGKVRIPDNINIRKQVVDSYGGVLMNVKSIYDISSAIKRWR